MTIYADPPRRYKARGARWSHVFSPDYAELRLFAEAHGLRRRHTKPFVHYDVTDEELESLPLTRVGRREVFTIMGRTGEAICRTSRTKSPESAC